MSTYPTFAKAINSILNDVYFFGNELKVRDLETKEITNYKFTITNPLSCMFENKAHGSKFQYIAGELIWYFLGRNDVEYISKYSNFWKNICNADGTCNSAYGNLIFKDSIDLTPDKTENKKYCSQYTWALNSLISDMYSRQAIIHFNLPIHQYENNKDFVCTMYAIFQIRPDDNDIPYLNMTVCMRSNDVVFGLMNDVVFFSVLQIQMFKHLKQSTYSNLKLGTYTHISNSMHLYGRHYDKASKMLDENFKEIEIPMLDIDLIDINGKPNELLEFFGQPEWVIENASTDLLNDNFYLFLANNAQLK